MKVGQRHLIFFLIPALHATFASANIFSDLKNTLENVYNDIDEKMSQPHGDGKFDILKQQIHRVGDKAVGFMHKTLSGQTPQNGQNGQVTEDDILEDLNHGVQVCLRNATPVVGDLQKIFGPSHMLEVYTDNHQRLSKPQDGTFDFWRQVHEVGEKAAEFAQKTLLGQPSQIDQYAQNDILEDLKHGVQICMISTTPFAGDLHKVFGPSHRLEEDTGNDLLEDIKGGVQGLLTTTTSFFGDIVQKVFDTTHMSDEAKRSVQKQREKDVTVVLDTIEDMAVAVTSLWNAPRNEVKESLASVKNGIKDFVLSIGRIRDEQPVLFDTALFAVAGFMVMPLMEGAFRHMLLGTLGFSPQGPVKGSLAAWAQSHFFGAAVPDGSWFAWLQSAGMTEGSALGLGSEAAITAIPAIVAGAGVQVHL